MGISERKEREKEARIGAIIGAAENLFFTRGYENTTVNDIMQKAELGKGTFYLYFVSKEDLYHAIALRGMEKLLPMFNETYSINETGIDKVIHLGFTLLEFYKKHPNYFLLMTYDGYNGITNEDTPTQKKLTEKSNKLMEIMIDALNIGIKDDTIRNDLNPQSIMYIIMSTTQSLIRSSFPRSNDLAKYMGISADQIFNDYYRLIYCAISNKNSHNGH